MKKFKRLLCSLVCFSVFFAGGQALALSNAVLDTYAGTGFTQAGRYTNDMFKVTGADVKITHTTTKSKHHTKPSVYITLYRWNSYGIKVNVGGFNVIGMTKQSKTFSNIINDDYKLYIQSNYADEVDFNGTVTD